MFFRRVPRNCEACDYYLGGNFTSEDKKLDAQLLTLTLASVRKHTTKTVRILVNIQENKVNVMKTIRPVNNFKYSQCYNPSCLEIRGALAAEDRATKNFCQHIVQAKEALRRLNFAKTEVIDVEHLVAKIADEELEKSFMNESSDGEMTVFLLPNDTYAVPILDMFQSAQGEGEDFVHVKDYKCSLDICNKKSRSKVHTLLEKGVPVCPHSMLGMLFFICLS